MAVTVTPEQTFALLVGIERYAGGWEPLDGPAHDAARFAQWLCSKGVPPRNIIALVSMHRDRHEYPFPAGCRISRATMPAFAYVIKHVLPSLDGKGLFFHWGGHGIVDDDRQRSLFLSDATDSLLESVEVMKLLRFLRSTRMKALEQQWFVFDACANRFRTAAMASALSPLALPYLKDAWRHSQHVMFAASVGETAANLSADRKGLFSGELLDALMAAPGGEWPPNLRQIAEQIDERFVALKGQRPEYWWHKMGDREPSFFGSVTATESSAPMTGGVTSAAPVPPPAPPRTGTPASELTSGEFDLLFDLAILRDGASPADLARIVLQPDILDLITGRVVRTVSDELRSGAIECLDRRSLLRLQSYEFVQAEQRARVLRPVLDALDNDPGNGAVEHLHALAPAARARPRGYAAANLVNLLATCQSGLTPLDLSGTDLRGADFRAVSARDLDLRGCNLSGAAFGDAFTSMLSAAFSPDGRLIAAANADGIIRVWNIDTGEQVSALRGHTDWAWAVTFNPTGQLLASSGDDRTIRLWDLETGTQRHALRGHEDWVRAIAFSPDGRLLASGSQDATLRVWDVASGEFLRELAGHQDQIWSLAFNPATRVLASGSGDGTVCFWDVDGTTPNRRIEADGGRVFSVAFSADGEWLATAGDSRDVRVWHAHTGQHRTTLTGHQRRVWRAVFDPTSTAIVSSSEDQTVRLWNWRTGEGRVVRQHDDFVRSVAHHPSEPWIGSASDDQSVVITRATDGRTIRSWRGWGEPLYAVTFAPDGNSLFTGGREGVSRWDLTATTHGTPVVNHASRVWAVAANRNTQTGKAIGGSGGDDETLRLWSLDDPEDVSVLEGHGKPLWCVAFTPGGDLVATGSEDRTARIWNTDTRQEIGVCEGHTSWVRAAAFSPDGSRLATGSDDRTIRLWTPAAAPVGDPLRGHEGRVWGLAFHPEGLLLASGGDDGVVRVWDLSQPGERIDLPGHGARIWSVAFSPAGEYLASSSSDRTIRIWDVARRREMRVLTGHTRWVRSVAFSADGRLASASEDGTVRLWDVESGTSTGVLSPVRPYEGVRITGAQGLSPAQREALVLQGAIDEVSPAS